MTNIEYLTNIHQNKILNTPVFFQHQKQIEIISKVLNKNNMLILSGIKHVGKISFIKEFLTKTGQLNQCFYYNNELDTENNIKSGGELISNLNEVLKYNKNIKIIILENFNKVENIKDFIHHIYSHQNNFKTILLGNTIKINGVKEIELLPENFLQNINKITFEDIFSFGLLPEIILIKNEYFKKQFLDLIVSDIFTKEIFFNFGVKSIDSYKLTMTYLSKLNNHLSLRELQKGLTTVKQITLKTTIDYIDFSIRAKIIKPIYLYDIKKDSIISSRVKYYFTDTGIRNSISQYNLSEFILKENLLFQELTHNNYTINSGINGTFKFTFIIEKEGEKLFLHYSQQTEKTELKKEINKLNKIPGEAKRYLIIENLEDFQIKKVIYDNVEIVEYINIFKKLR